MSSSTESRKLRNEMLLERFSGTIAKFEKTLADLKKDGMTRMKVDIRTTDHKPVCRCPPSATGRRAAAKCTVSAANALLMKRQKLEKDLFCPNTEGCALVRRVATIDHKPVRRPPSPPSDALLMRKRRNELEMERNNLKRREAIQKKREAARREIAQMRNTSGIYDPLELVRDLEKMLGYSITGYKPQPALPIPDYYKSLIKTTDDMIISCCEDEKKKVDEEVEEGEIID